MATPQAEADAASRPDDGDWLAGARRVDSPNCDDRPPAASIDLIVIHAIALPPATYGGAYIERLFTNRLDCTAHPYFEGLRGLRVSAHFLIERDGVLSQFVALSQRAWHAGESRWRGRSACNDFSIGIELEGCDEHPFAAVQYSTLVGLLGELLRRFPTLGVDSIAGHSDIAPDRKTDPGPMFDWPRLLREAPR